MVVGRPTFTADLLARLGVEVVGGDGEGRYPNADIAALDDPGQVRDDSTALRAVLLLRLGQILGWSPADAAAWHGAAAAVVLRRQCTPITAIAAADPQEVLGGFGDCRGGPAPLARQLAPLLTLHHLLQLPGDHASA